jgi:manganese/zinc/iron transport system permease protein
MQSEIIIIAILASLACVIPGVFLLLRKMALISDAISHAILPGIVIGYLIKESLNTPYPIIGAVVFAMIMVVTSEALHRSNLVKPDTAIAVVFPPLFSLGVILVSLLASNVHLDTDAVLLGELAFAPLDRMIVFGSSVPKSLVKMLIIVIINLAVALFLFKELKVSTFDPILSKSLGFPPTLLHYLLMLMTSITAVGAFDSVGAVLVLAFMITPAATALLLTSSLSLMIVLSFGLATASSVLGVLLALRLDAGISGAISTVMGGFFILAYLFSPTSGIVTKMRNKIRIKNEYALSIVMYHLLNHSTAHDMERECSFEHLAEQFSYPERYLKKIVNKAIEKGYVKETDAVFAITEKGKDEAILRTAY